LLAFLSALGRQKFSASTIATNSLYVNLQLTIALPEQVSRTFYADKDVDVDISEINDGIYRISGLIPRYQITFNQFLIDDENPTLIHTGPIGMYEKIADKVKEVIPLEKLTNVAFLHFESDEWGGMDFLKAPKARLVCGELTSRLNLSGWNNVPVDHISFWENEILKTGKRRFRFIMTPHVHHWDSMMMFEETTKSLFPSDLFIQPGQHKPVTSDDLSKDMIQLYNITGIFASEEPVRKTAQKLVKLDPKLICPMHGSAFDSSVLPKYVDALMNEQYAYSNKLLGRELEEKPLNGRL
jgi:flavorubredoxin